MAKIANNQINYAEVNSAFAALRDEVKDRYTIDCALQDEFSIRLTGNGDVRSACCPFHVEKTPSFTVSISKGYYRCFGSGCEEYGDVFKLIMDRHNLDFRDAVLFAADRAGIIVPDMLRGNRQVNARASKPAVRSVVVKDPTAPNEIPADLKTADFIPVDARMRRPHPGILFRLHRDGKNDLARDSRRGFYRPEMVHEYRDVDDQLLMAVLRLRYDDGRKFFIPASLRELPPETRDVIAEKVLPNGNLVVWVNQGPKDGTLKPIYGMEAVREWVASGGTEILVVEGEKTKDSGARQISRHADANKWLVLSPMGGAGATPYADWAPLLSELNLDNQGKINFHYWPDADKPLERHDGTIVDRVKKATLQVMTSFAQAVIDNRMSFDNFSLMAVTPPQGVESGWDIADAEAEGWMPEQLVDYIANKKYEVPLNMLNIRQITAQPSKEDDCDADFSELHDAAPADDSVWLELSEGNSSRNIDPELVDGELREATASDEQLNQDVLAQLGLDDVEPTEVVAVKPDEVSTGTGEENPLLENFDDEHETPRADPILANPYFRCLGYRDHVDYFMSLSSGQVFGLPPRNLKQEYLLHLAPLSFWAEMYAKMDQRGNMNGIDWTRAANDLIQNCYAAGVWDPRLQVTQGARIDGRKVVFNTGSRLYVQGRDGTCPLWDFQGRYCYTIGPTTRTPAFDHPFTADSSEIKELLRIIQALDWRDDMKQLSVLSLFGWIMISPICGILKWRPHLWLDGPLSSGKSWIAKNLVRNALGDYCENVVSNSTESGIRNMLNCRNIPIIFDEAEGEGSNDRKRMDCIMRLARHSASENDAVVAQGISGGGATTSYSIDSTFLMTSIMPQLEAAADKSRFARAHLGHGRPYDEFYATIEMPTYNLLVEPQEIEGNSYTFADRMVARMVMRGCDYEKTYRMMVQALTRFGHQRRVADIYGTFAAGAWLALRDDVPELIEDCVMWIADTFDVMPLISEINEDLSTERDHYRVFREISMQQIRFESRNAGARTHTIGDLMAVASGMGHEDDVIISPDEAREQLMRIGLRPGLEEGEICPTDGTATHMLVHRSSPALRNMMENTPYARSFIDVMRQADGVRIGKKALRFGAALGAGTKPLVVPIEYFIATE